MTFAPELVKPSFARCAAAQTFIGRLSVKPTIDMEAHIAAIGVGFCAKGCEAPYASDPVAYAEAVIDWFVASGGKPTDLIVAGGAALDLLGLGVAEVEKAAEGK